MATGVIKKFANLLWTNPNPTSSFPAQTVQIDLSGYDAVIVDANYTSSSYAVSVIVFKDHLDIQMNAVTNLQTTGSVGYGNRNVSMTSTGVTFSGGYTKSASSTGAATADNARLVPQSIYGLRL